MKAVRPTRRPRTRAALAAVGLTLGGLAPLATGLVGVHGYLTRGYFISKAGERVDGPLGLVVSAFFVLAGLAMIAHAILKYRHKRRSDS